MLNTQLCADTTNTDPCMIGRIRCMSYPCWQSHVQTWLSWQLKYDWCDVYPVWLSYVWLLECVRKVFCVLHTAWGEVYVVPGGLNELVVQMAVSKEMIVVTWCLLQTDGRAQNYRLSTFPELKVPQQQAKNIAIQCPWGKQIRSLCAVYSMSSGLIYILINCQKRTLSISFPLLTSASVIWRRIRWNWNEIEVECNSGL